MIISTKNTVKILLTLAVLANIMTWYYARDIKSLWGNVPPVPSVLGVSAFALGDQQLAYRTTGVMLQNLGDASGQSTPLDQYNYEELAKWLHLTDKLDSESSFVPYLASFYFSAVQDTSMLAPVLDYLHVVGQRTSGEHWRWLAQAVYLARYKMENLDLALKYAEALAAIDNKDMPAWSRQMAAFVQNAKGNKEEAIGMLLSILKAGGDNIHPSEIINTHIYICDRLLDEEEAAVHPLCENLPARAR